MSYLWNKDIVLQAGMRKIEARSKLEPDKAKPMLRVNFRVDKSLSKDPNVATVTIYNLASDNRKGLKKKDPLIIEAGYTDTREQIFSGDINYISHQREGSDWVTYLESGDGSLAIATARINKAFGPNTTVYDFLKAVSAAMGVGLGNTITSLNPYTTFRNGMRKFSHGAVAHGKVDRVLDQYLAPAGLNWSIQDGELQILEPTSATLDDVVLLSSKTGMVGSPEVGEKGKIVVRSLLQGKIAPGRRIVIESRQVKGQYKIEKVTHVGDTYHQDWYTEAEAKPL